MPTHAYFDYNATTPLKSEAKTAMAQWLDRFGNPSSVHKLGREARAAVEVAREQVAAAVGANPSQVIFTSGGTEANALALGAVSADQRYCSAIEHDAVLSHIPHGRHLPVGSNGLLDLSRMEDALSDGDLLSVMLANNETGAIQPVREAAEISHEAGGLIHTDAVQALGKIPFSFSELTVDLMSVSAHKIGGPAGVGALVVKEGIDITPLMSGGGQEKKKRPGTENLLGIIGFGAAAHTLDSYGYACQVAPLRALFEQAVHAVPGARVFDTAERLPNTSCVALEGAKSETQVMALDLEGIAVSAGSACSSGKVTPSHVLSAMGEPESTARGAIRVSMGWNTTREEVVQLSEAWTKMALRLSSATEQ